MLQPNNAHPTPPEPTPTNDNSAELRHYGGAGPMPSCTTVVTPFSVQDHARVRLYGAAVQYTRALDGIGKLSIPDAASDLVIAAGHVSGELSSHPRFDGLVNMLQHAAGRLDRSETDEQAIDALMLASMARHELQQKLGLAEDPHTDWLRLKLSPAAAVALTSVAAIEKIGHGFAAAVTASLRSVAAQGIVTADAERAFATQVEYAEQRADISPATRLLLAENKASYEAAATDAGNGGRGAEVG